MNKRNTHALAMSEGWAHFVAIFLRSQQRPTRVGALRRGGPPKWEYKGVDWKGNLAEQASTLEVRKGQNVEFNVAWALVDLLRHPDEGFTFPELFKVYSPELEALSYGPLVFSLDDYLDRLKALFPNRASRVEEVRSSHV